MNLKKNALIIMLITTISQILGFVRDVTLSYFYGTSFFSDAYLVSTTITNVVYSFIMLGISTSYIPIFRRIESNFGIIESNKYTNNVASFILFISTLIFCISFIFVESIVKLLASGFNSETIEMTVNFTKIGLISIYFTGLVYLFSAYLQLKDKFIVPALIGIPYNLVIILSIFLSYKISSNIIAIGIVVSSMIQLFLIIPFLRGAGYKYERVFNLRDKNIKQMIFISLPVIIGSSINEINIMVSKAIASQIGVGAVSSLTYADRLVGFIYGLFIMSIVTVIYPSLAKMASVENIAGVKKALQNSILSIFLLVMPASIGFMILNDSIVKLLFGRGAFDDKAVIMTSQVLFFLSIGVLWIGIREILTRVYFALQDTKTPVINASIAVIINIILSFILSNLLGIVGLALANSIAAIICALLLTYRLQKRIGIFIDKNLLISLLKISFSTFIMALIVKYTFSLMQILLPHNLGLILSILIGGISYCLLVWLMKIELVKETVSNLFMYIKKS